MSSDSGDDLPQQRAGRKARRNTMADSASGDDEAPAACRHKPANQLGSSSDDDEAPAPSARRRNKASLLGDSDEELNPEPQPTKRKKRNRDDSYSEDDDNGKSSESEEEPDTEPSSEEDAEEELGTTRGAIRKLVTKRGLRKAEAANQEQKAEEVPEKCAEPVELADGFSIRAELVQHMQPHQIHGVKFMFDHARASQGCILAHCMGLGKTLQALAMLDTLIVRPSAEDDYGAPEDECVDLTIGDSEAVKCDPEGVGSAAEGADGSAAEGAAAEAADGSAAEGAAAETAQSSKNARVVSVLVVCPVNVIENWYKEWDKWLSRGANHRFYLLKDAGTSNAKRTKLLEEWLREGGILVCGYDQYRNITNAKVKDESQKALIKRALVDPGPDVVVCDEGHVLRNEKSGISKALSNIRTRRRVILTGTPMQNNLLEYHCMVDFACPGTLGSRADFTKAFAIPIGNGQSDDATDMAKKVMRNKLYVLDELLTGVIDRCDLKILAEYLPPKREFAVSVRMSPLQEKLYRKYLETAQDVDASTGKGLFNAYHSLAKVWTHPGVLVMDQAGAEEREVKGYESMDDFVVVSSDEEWSDDCPSDEFGSESKKKKKKKKANDEDEILFHEGGKRKKQAKKEVEADTKDTSGEWFHDILTESNVDVNEPGASGKIVLLLELLREAAATHEKLLLFSQSLVVLELIERILHKSGRWKLGVDYFRLDGSTATKTRQGWVERFNDPHQRRARLFLISTKAGGLGVNLTAASRVVIFDAAWNPSIDTQAVFRAFRFGQEKQVVVYRLLAQGTMEEKIYRRQTSKNKLAAAVLDNEQTAAVVMKEDLDAKCLLTFTPADADATVQNRPESDPVLCRLLDKLPNLIVSVDNHDAMADCQDDGLDDNEKEQAQIDLVRYKTKQAEKPKKAKTAAKPKKADKPLGFQPPALTGLVPVGSIAATPQVAAEKAAAKTALSVASSIPKAAKPKAKRLQVPGKQASMLTFFNKSAADKTAEKPEERAEAGDAALKTESEVVE